MADKLEQAAAAMTRRAYDILIEAEMQPQETREEYAERYTDFYTALAEAALEATAWPIS